MTRKDFIWLADQLRVLRNRPTCAADRGIVQHWILDLVDTLQQQHPRFDKLKFLKACGML